MTALAIIVAPSALLTLALEAREGRTSPMAAGLDGGIVICLAALVLRVCGVI